MTRVCVFNVHVIREYRMYTPPKLKEITAAGVIAQESDLGRRCRSVVAIIPSSLRPYQFHTREDGSHEVGVVNEAEEDDESSTRLIQGKESLLSRRLGLEQIHMYHPTSQGTEHYFLSLCILVCSCVPRVVFSSSMLITVLIITI